jgi:hypothetical protein
MPYARYHTHCYLSEFLEKVTIKKSVFAGMALFGDSLLALLFHVWHWDACHTVISPGPYLRMRLSSRQNRPKAHKNLPFHNITFLFLDYFTTLYQLPGSCSFEWCLFQYHYGHVGIWYRLIWYGVGIATGWKAGVRFPAEKIFLLSTASRQALGPI